MLEEIPMLVNSEMNKELIKEVTKVEVKEAVFQLGAFKAPGPDGFSGVFYQKCWGIVKEDVVRAVVSFFEDGRMNNELNNTDVVLIPKMYGPEMVSHFRPISLCNFLYKVISKVMVNRLKHILPHYISDSQSAFVSGKLITDNVLIVYELLHT